MGRWIKIIGTSRADLMAKVMEAESEAHQILKEDLPGYDAERYAQPGSSILFHKTKLEAIMKTPNVENLKWQKMKSRVGEIPHWGTPIKITNDDPNYFNRDII